MHDPAGETRTDEPIQQTVWLSVYSPVFDEAVDKWEFRLGTDHFLADISQTSIAKDALERGGAMVNDKYQVRLQKSESNDASGKTTYKILEVMTFIRADMRASDTETEGVPPEPVGEG
jgi:hypothetical protein